MNERIKKIRSETGLNQVDFGEKIGIKGSSVSLIEAGQREPSERVIRGICQAFGISREWLETGQGEMKVPDPTASQMVMRVMRGQNEYAKQVMAAFATLDDSEWERLKELVDKLKKAGL